ncbi:MAG: recombinase family protein [Alphaproteobacteria bacterium]|nr:MAG: recombinase family protein [Alphaproteobacteria bacterium]
MAEKKRCAIYTRKSTEEGLEQDFNSLDAQREACAAYILSQAAEGWEQVREHYDDGGWSGGTLDRPGLRQLLSDVRSSKIDIIVVYKVDRLTRSLADFAKIVEILDEHEASFVSVTQAFNTTNSMGRLTLNVLLSFAQFEREVTGERIRDKIAASKQKGMWMGGPIPLGYRLEDRKLLIEPDEATTVRMIFDRYCELRSMPRLVTELAREGVRTKQRTYKTGKVVGGIPFGKGMLGAFLKNPLYTGRVKHNDNIYDGEHDAIISIEQFERVQEILKDNGQEWKLGRRASNPSLLTSLLADPDGRPMTPEHTSRANKRYRYYATRFEPGEDTGAPWRVPAGDLERAAIRIFQQWLKRDVAGEADNIIIRRDLADRLADQTILEQRKVFLDYDARFKLDSDALSLIMDKEDGKKVAMSLPALLVRHGKEMKLALPPEGHTSGADPDPTLMRLVAQAMAAQRMILKGTDDPAISSYSKRYLWQLLRISWLAPDIISAIVEGRQPAGLTGRRLLRAAELPLKWSEQRDFLGLS